LWAANPHGNGVVLQRLRLIRHLRRKNPRSKWKTTHRSSNRRRSAWLSGPNRPTPSLASRPPVSLGSRGAAAHCTTPSSGRVTPRPRADTDDGRSNLFISTCTRTTFAQGEHTHLPRPVLGRRLLVQWRPGRNGLRGAPGSSSPLLLNSNLFPMPTRRSHRRGWNAALDMINAS